jgi:serine/threonine-protein kinase
VGGRYKIITRIGAGGMSDVYLSIDTSLNKQWAVKEIRHSADEVTRDLVVRSLTTEAALLKGLDHPAIPRIVDLIDENGSLYVVMDYVEGQDLGQLLRETGPQDEQDVVDWGIQLCDALDYLHQRDPAVVYRDMKPSNIMLRPDGSIKLIDFGIAREIGETIDGAALLGDDREMGTAGFGSPEQFEDGTAVDIRSDIYSLGATLFFLVTGVHPHKNGVQPIRELNPELSIGLETVLLTATAEDPHERFQDCAEMAYALANYRKADDEYQSDLKARWRKFWTVTGASVAALTLAAASVGMARYSQTQEFDYWMERGNQATQLQDAEDNYYHATQIAPANIEPYLALIDRYVADEVLVPEEEQAYNTAITNNSPQLRENTEQWAQLAYETGKMYWYYYQTDAMDADQDVDQSIRMERIRAAAKWMKYAAEAEADNFAEQHTARVYAGIAEFNTQIVPLINEGSDAGMYGPYFEDLQDLVSITEASNNAVVRLEVANFVLNTLQTYPRNFRSDGIGQQDMQELIDATEMLAEAVEPTTSSLDHQQQTAMDALGPTRKAVAQAFVDVTGNHH